MAFNEKKSLHWAPCLGTIIPDSFILSEFVPMDRQILILSMNADKLTIFFLDISAPCL